MSCDKIIWDQRKRANRDQPRTFGGTIALQSLCEPVNHTRQPTQDSLDGDIELDTLVFGRRSFSYFEPPKDISLGRLRFWRKMLLPTVNLSPPFNVSRNE